MNEKRFQAAVAKILTQCLKVQHKDSLALIYGSGAEEFGDLFFRMSKRAASEIMKIQFTDPEISRAQLEILHFSLKKVAAAVIIHPGISATSLPAWLNSPERIKILCVNADCAEKFCDWVELKVNRVNERTMKVADLITIGNRLHLATAAGTNLKMSIRRKHGIADTGIVNTNCKICSLPGGEVRIQPETSTVNGSAIINFFAGNRPGKESVELIIKSGEIRQIRGQNKSADFLRREMRRLGPAGRRIFEFSFGINEHFDFGRSYFEDRKALGGSTISFGDRAQRAKEFPSPPVCGVMLEPSISIDNRIILANRKILA